MTEKDPDGLHLVTAKMLADSLKMNLKDLMPAAASSQTDKKQIDSTAIATSQIKTSVNRFEEVQTVAPFIYSSAIDRSAEQQYQPQVKETSVFNPYPQKRLSVHLSA